MANLGLGRGHSCMACFSYCNLDCVKWTNLLWTLYPVYVTFNLRLTLSHPYVILSGIIHLEHVIIWRPVSQSSNKWMFPQRGKLFCIVQYFACCAGWRVQWPEENRLLLRDDVVLTNLTLTWLSPRWPASPAAACAASPPAPRSSCGSGTGYPRTPGHHTH